MKIAAFGIKNPNTVCLKDEVSDKDIWYYVSDRVKDYLKRFNKGDTVDIETQDSEKGKTITFVKLIQKGEGGSSSHGGASNSSYASSGGTKKTFYGKSPDEQDRIESQALGHMVSRTIIG